jgi:pilus assembly protein Flp/PilA
MAVSGLSADVRDAGHRISQQAVASLIACMKMLRAFLADESGATAIEYGSLAIIAVVNGLGTKLNTKFTSINTSLK